MGVSERNRNECKEKRKFLFYKSKSWCNYNRFNYYAELVADIRQTFHIAANEWQTDRRQL